MKKEKLFCNLHGTLLVVFFLECVLGNGFMELFCGLGPLIDSKEIFKVRDRLPADRNYFAVFLLDHGSLQIV